MLKGWSLVKHAFNGISRFFEKNSEFLLLCYFFTWVFVCAIFHAFSNYVTKMNKKSRGSPRSPRSSARNTCLRQVCTVSQARRVVAATWLLAAILALPRNWIQVLQDSGHPSILSIHTIHPVRPVRHPTLFSLKPIMPFIQKAIYTIKRCVSRVTSVSSIRSV